MKKVICIVSINIILILLTSCVGKTTTMKLDGNKVSISEFDGWQFLHPLNEISKDNEMVEVSERRMNDEGGIMEHITKLNYIIKNTGFMQYYL